MFFHDRDFFCLVFFTLWMKNVISVPDPSHLKPERACPKYVSFVSFLLIVSAFAFVLSFQMPAIVEHSFNYLIIVLLYG